MSSNKNVIDQIDEISANLEKQGITIERALKKKEMERENYKSIDILDEISKKLKEESGITEGIYAAYVFSDPTLRIPVARAIGMESGRIYYFTINDLVSDLKL